MQKILSQKFFDRDPVTVCKELLGDFLVIKKNWTPKKYIITEVEAYDGEEDEACHARHGKTERNAPMFGTSGHWYVYMIYGMYYMLNIVTWPGNHPSAILIRWLKELPGPGKLTKGLWIDKSFNGKIANEETGLWIEQRISDDNAWWFQKMKIYTAPRIGIDYASDEWRNKHRRFYIK